MKTTIISLITSAITLISPVVPMVLLAILMVILDTFFGIWRTVKLKGWDDVLSKKLSEIFTKMLLYGGAIVVVYLIERYIAGDIVAQFIAVELFMTKVVAGAVVYTEIKSIDEKYKQVKGKSFLKGLRGFVTRVKEEKENLDM
jgi:predicted neutral ceramidase superfamily lipid hydrolase